MGSEVRKPDFKSSSVIWCILSKHYSLVIYIISLCYNENSSNSTLNGFSKKCE